MKLKNKIILSLIITLNIFVFIQTSAEARKKILPGRSGMASVEVTVNDFYDVADAVKYVFAEDGYTLKDEWGSGLHFLRPAARSKDFSYGGLAGGQWEQVMVDIHTVGRGKYRIECNVYMTDGDRNPVDMDVKILRLFGREYQRMLRRIKRKIN